MSNLEHNIKEAFDAQDAKTKLGGKDAIWNRLESQMGQGKGVAAFWRIAAVFLGFLLFTGAYAAMNMRAKQQNMLDKVELSNAKLSATIDSLLSLPITTQTEIVEKEKIVYRERPVISHDTDFDKLWERRYKQLTDSTELILANNETLHKQEITKLNAELTATRQELSKIEQALDVEEKSKPSAPFELKSEQVELGISKKPSTKNPEIEIKVFQKNFIENRNNLNRTIFKK